MTTPEIVSVTKDVLVAIAAIVTASVATWGVSNWNRELRARTGFEAARALARATYRLRDALREYRSPLLRAWEFPEGHIAGNSPADPTAEGNAYQHLYSRRWDRIRLSLEDIEAATLEAEALWGSAIGEKVSNLIACASQLASSTEAFISDKMNGGEDFRDDPKFGKEIRSTIAASATDDKNSFSRLIREAVSAIEEELRPHLMRPSWKLRR